MIEPITGPAMQAAYLAATPTFAKAFIRRSPEELAAEFAHSRQIALREFFGPTKAHSVSHPRQECMAMLAERGFSLPRIGRVFNRDHTTVHHGIEAVKRRARG
ncbi:helix-turn-helix domain-containing protein [Sulfitobacter faviae]|uniref:helix-turn-helix domain-containing protein n=1 Tax=Sulfitobacter faviae TaxID=1775881 RepID=UPI002307FE1C|nr:helix-turn-helix domain-containing protein [Sulfitobacter faviae]WCE67958.1 helix-turn-helix domain-containing protein [Sulfitobacter faviae]